MGKGALTTIALDQFGGVFTLPPLLNGDLSHPTHNTTALGCYSDSRPKHKLKHNKTEKVIKRLHKHQPPQYNIMFKQIWCLTTDLTTT